MGAIALTLITVPLADFTLPFNEVRLLETRAWPGFFLPGRRLPLHPAAPRLHIYLICYAYNVYRILP